MTEEDKNIYENIIYVDEYNGVLIVYYIVKNEDKLEVKIDCKFAAKNNLTKEEIIKNMMQIEEINNENGKFIVKYEDLKEEITFTVTPDRFQALFEMRRIQLKDKALQNDSNQNTETLESKIFVFTRESSKDIGWQYPLESVSENSKTVLKSNFSNWINKPENLFLPKDTERLSEWQHATLEGKTCLYRFCNTGKLTVHGRGLFLLYGIIFDKEIDYEALKNSKDNIEHVDQKIREIISTIDLSNGSKINADNNVIEIQILQPHNVKK